MTMLPRLYNVLFFHNPLSSVVVTTVATIIIIIMTFSCSLCIYLSTVKSTKYFSIHTHTDGSYDSMSIYLIFIIMLLRNMSSFVCVCLGISYFIFFFFEILKEIGYLKFFFFRLPWNAMNIHSS